MSVASMPMLPLDNNHIGPIHAHARSSSPEVSWRTAISCKHHNIVLVRMLFLSILRHQRAASLTTHAGSITNILVQQTSRTLKTQNLTRAYKVSSVHILLYNRIVPSPHLVRETPLSASGPVTDH